MNVVWFWVRAVPVLIRPVFTWTGALAPPAEVVKPLQEHAGTVVMVAVAAVAARMWHQFPLAFDAGTQARFDALQDALRKRPELVTEPSVPRKWLRALARGAFTTFLAVGIYADRLEAIVMFAATTVLSLALSGVVKIPLGSWPRLAARIPILLRIVVGLAVLRAGAEWLLRNPLALGGPKDLFRPFVVATLFTLVIVYCLAAPLHAGSTKEQRLSEVQGE